MMPNMTSMLEEMIFIKQAWEPPSKEELKQLAKDVAGVGIGLGAGAGAGYAIRKKLLPKALPHLGPKTTTGLITGTGALVGLLGSQLYQQHQKRLDDAKQRNS